MSIQLTIVTPQGETFAERVDTVVLPGSEGDFGVLEGHERFLAPLRIGPVSIQTGGVTRWAAASRGFADVAGGDVVVLVDQCQLGEDIDAGEIEAARADAEAALRDGSEGRRVLLAHRGSAERNASLVASVSRSE